MSIMSMLWDVDHDHNIMAIMSITGGIATVVKEIVHSDRAT